MTFAFGLMAEAALVAGPAMAADPGFYAGVGMGYSKININSDKLDNNIDAALSDTTLFVENSDVDRNCAGCELRCDFRTRCAATRS